MQRPAVRLVESIAGFRDFALIKFVHTDHDASDDEFDSNEEELEPEQLLLDKRAVLIAAGLASVNASRAATHPSQRPPQPPQSYMPPWMQPQWMLQGWMAPPQMAPPSPWAVSTQEAPGYPGGWSPQSQVNDLDFADEPSS